MDTQENGPDFVENSHPKDGELSVTGNAPRPVHGAPVEHSTGESLATGGLGAHVMDDESD